MKESDEPNIYDYDKNNKAAINRAFESGRINEQARDYLINLYTDSMKNFREVFQVMGKLLGAPKAQVLRYNSASCEIIDKPIKISEINPTSAYMVNHRLDADPMRNQFFTINNNQVNLSISSIVGVIIGAQKSLSRTLDKITGKYYESYLDGVIKTVKLVLADDFSQEEIVDISDKINEKFSEDFITNASETVLSVIGAVDNKIVVNLVRELDKIIKPHLRLNDVWRARCLFDMVPQVRTFVERIRETVPDRILDFKDSFCSLNQPRNYRDIKIILNIGTFDNVIPMEIICQVRTFFEIESLTHSEYEKSRLENNLESAEITERLTNINEDGVRKYNAMICNCLDDLFDRVGWNVLYRGRTAGTLFDGFPRDTKHYYSQKIVDAVLDKIDNAVENEIFMYHDAPAKLSVAEEMEIFRWMTNFILLSAVPYRIDGWKVPGDSMAVKLFNFIMKDLHRYIK